MQSNDFHRFASRSIFSLTLSALLSFSFSQSAIAQSPQVLSEIEELYAQGNYAQALSLIDENMHTFKVSANLYYLKGNILVSQGQRSQAILDYEAALRANPSPTVKAYSEAALANIRFSPQAQVPVYMTPPAMPSLDKQVRHELHQNQKQSAAAGRQMQAESAEYQQIHSAKTDAIVNDMQNAGRYNHKGDWLPAYDPADIAAVQARRQAKEGAVMRQFARSNQDLQNAAQDRASAVQDSADGLHSQMRAVTRPGEAVLDPNGSNLFVRNYSEPPSILTPKPATVTVP